MNGYETRHEIVPALADGRLARVTVTPHLLSYEHLEGTVDPRLIRDLAEMSRHVGRSGMQMIDMSMLGARPFAEHYVVRVPDDLMSPLNTFALHLGKVGGRPFYEFRIRASLMAAEVACEFNEEIFPSFIGAMVPVTRPVVPVLDPLDLFDAEL